MTFKLQPLDLSETFGIGLAISEFFQKKQQLKTEELFQQGMYSVYKSQQELNNQIRSFNLHQRMFAASKQAASVYSAFASAGLTGGTISDDLQNYQRNLLINSMSDSRRLDN